jgi:hypothetical protein
VVFVSGRGGFTVRAVTFGREGSITSRQLETALGERAIKDMMEQTGKSAMSC